MIVVLGIVMLGFVLYQVGVDLTAILAGAGIIDIVTVGAGIGPFHVGGLEPSGSVNERNLGLGVNSKANTHAGDYCNVLFHLTHPIL